VDTGRLDTGRPPNQLDGRPHGGESDERRGRRPGILDGHDDGNYRLGPGRSPSAPPSATPSIASGADVVLIKGADAATGLSSPSSADRGLEAIRGIVADANPRLRLAGVAGLLLAGSHNGCWR
jgi:hypothetical protein